MTNSLYELICTNMDEGPVRGISNLMDPKVYLEQVLEKAGACGELTERDKGIVENIRQLRDRAS